MNIKKDSGPHARLLGIDLDCGRAQKWKCIACGFTISPGTEAMTVVEFLGTQSPLLPITVLVHSDCLQGLRICPDVLEFRSMRLNHTADECDQEAAREALVASIRQFRPGFDFKEYLKSMSGKPPEDPEPAEADLPDLETALPGMTRKGNP